MMTSSIYAARRRSRHLPSGHGAKAAFGQGNAWRRGGCLSRFHTEDTAPIPGSSIPHPRAPLVAVGPAARGLTVHVPATAHAPCDSRDAHAPERCLANACAMRDAHVPGGHRVWSVRGLHCPSCPPGLCDCYSFSGPRVPVVLWASNSPLPVLLCSPKAPLRFPLSLNSPHSRWGSLTFCVPHPSSLIGPHCAP